MAFLCPLKKSNTIQGVSEGKKRLAVDWEVSSMDQNWDFPLDMARADENRSDMVLALDIGSMFDKDLGRYWKGQRKASCWEDSWRAPEDSTALEDRRRGLKDRRRTAVDGKRRREH